METDYASDSAYAAIVRNALAADDKPVRVIRKRTRNVLPVDPIPDDAREQYEHELNELMFRIMDERGLHDFDESTLHDRAEPSAEIKQAAVSELGCLEFWDLMNSQPAFFGATLRLARLRTEKTFCVRCESVGHQLQACPFPDDEQTRKIALLRRERRRGEKEVAA